MYHLDHIGIFVKNIPFGIKELKKIFNVKKKSKIFNDKFLKVKIQFVYDKRGNCYELVAPFGKNSPVNNVIRSKKNILNHLAFITSNFNKDFQNLIKKGLFAITMPAKAVAFNNAKIVFLLSPLGFIVELIEKRRNISFHKKRWKEFISITSVINSKNTKLFA